MTRLRWRTSIFSFQLAVSLSFLSACATLTPEPPKKVDFQSDQKWIELRSRMNEQESEISRLKKEVETLKSEDPEEDTEAKPIPVMKLTPSSGDTKKPDEASDDDEEEGDEETIVDSRHEMLHLYYQGLAESEEGRYETAAKTFQDFLKENPNHVYADRAQFQVVDAYFRNKEFGLSVLEANRLQTLYPYSVKLPETLLEKAEAYKKLGRQDLARTALGELIQNFPKHRLANEAAKRLANE